MKWVVFSKQNQWIFWYIQSFFARILEWFPCHSTKFQMRPGFCEKLLLYFTPFLTCKFLRNNRQKLLKILLNVSTRFLPFNKTEIRSLRQELSRNGELTDFQNFKLNLVSYDQAKKNESSLIFLRDSTKIFLLFVRIFLLFDFFYKELVS